MTRKRAMTLGGIALGALSAAVVAAIIRYRMSGKEGLSKSDLSVIRELSRRLRDAYAGKEAENAAAMRRIIAKVQRDTGQSLEQLRDWLPAILKDNPAIDTIQAVYFEALILNIEEMAEREPPHRPETS